MTKTITIGASPLRISDVVSVARTSTRVAILPELLDRLAKTKAHILEHWTGDDGPLIYSLNTGVGAFKGQRVQPEDLLAYQRNIIVSHATGLGEPFARDVVRAMLLLR